MQEMGQDELQNQEVAAPVAPAVAQPTEKMIPASRVEEIIKGRLARAHSEAQASQGQQSMGGMTSMSEDQIRQMIDQAAERRAHDHMAHNIASSFVSKLEAGKGKYPDFDKVVGELNLPAHPHIVAWTNGLDNTADVIYDIASNPGKFANVLTLAATAPALAEKELRKLSESIKVNEQAAATPSENAPLSELKSSTVGVDNGKMSVRDFRKMPYLRG